ncbi:MAG: nucleotidyltransferase domain-containing protein [bacterium]
MKQLSEIKTISKEEQILLMRCSRAIKRTEPSAEVIFYGSRARGEASYDSDYDLLILIDGEVSLEKKEIIYHKLYPIELETEKVLSIIVYSKQQWDTPLYRIMPLHKNVEREGVVI